MGAPVVNATFGVKLSHHECEWDKGTQCRFVKDLLFSDSVRDTTTIGAMNAPTTLPRRIRTPRVGADVVARFTQPVPFWLSRVPMFGAAQSRRVFVSNV